MGDRDAHNEAFGEVQNVVPAGRCEMMLEDLFGYGMRVDVGPFLAALERQPEFPRACLARGDQPVLQGRKVSRLFAPVIRDIAC